MTMTEIQKNRSYEGFCIAVRQTLELRLPALYETARHYPTEKVSLAISQMFDLERFLKGKRIRADDLEPMLDANEKGLFQELRKMRSELAKKDNVPAYRVLTNQTLLALVRRKPLDQADLMAVPGVGEKTSEAYGEAILEVIRRNCFYDPDDMTIYMTEDNEGVLDGDYEL